MATNKHPPMVKIEWVDARSIYEQIELCAVERKCHLSQRFTLGFLVHKDREKLVLAGTFDPAERKLDPDYTPDDDGGADFTVIPRGWIKGIVTLDPSTAQEKEEAA